MAKKSRGSQVLLKSGKLGGLSEQDVVRLTGILKKYGTGLSHLFPYGVPRPLGIMGDVQVRRTELASLLKNLISIKDLHIDNVLTHGIPQLDAVVVRFRVGR